MIDQRASASTHDPATSAALTARDVTFAYEGGPNVVEALTAALKPGELTALIGPNAAGKSTLLKLMLGQLTPDHGVIHLEARPVGRIPARERARLISYVPQTGAVSFGFTVREVVAMGRFAAGSRAERDPSVDQALDGCDLSTIADRPFAHLSGGQQQRVVLARAIAQARGQGRAVLADEPGSHMDLWHLHHTMRTLRQLARDGLAVLVVIHDLNLAARYADRVWLMHQARLVADGPWHEVLRPDLLEPVYQVQLTDMTSSASDRPVFRVDLPETR